MTKFKVIAPQDDTGNSAPGFQAAIDSVYNSGGGIAEVESGKYRFLSGITLREGVTLQGEGWSPASEYWSNLPGKGSWIHVAAGGFVPINIEGNGASIKDLAFYHDQPPPRAGWAPIAYPPTIFIGPTPGGGGSQDIIFENVLLLNPTKGIYQGSASSGRLSIHKLWGQPLQTGLQVDSVQDTMMVEAVHFWPFWSNDLNVLEYTKNNAVGIRSARNDNPHFSNIFMLGYNVGIEFIKNHFGITSKFKITNFDADMCRSGILISGETVTGQITNMTTQGTDVSSSIGIFITQPANRVRLQASNLRFTDCQANGVRIDGEENWVALENIWVDNWDQSHIGFPAVECVLPSSRAWIGKARWFSGSGGGPETGWPAGTIILD